MFVFFIVFFFIFPDQTAVLFDVHSLYPSQGLVGSDSRDTLNSDKPTEGGKGTGDIFSFALHCIVG